MSTTRVTTGRVRLSYANLIEPRGFNGQEPKYSVTLIIPRSSTRTLDALRAAAQAAIDINGAKVFGGKVPKNVASTLKDADVDTNNSGDVYADINPEYKGCYILSCSSKNAPEIVDSSLSEIDNRNEIYSGMYARVSVTAFCYNVNGNRGVSFALGNVQKVADGEPLGNHASAENDFSDWDDDDDYDTESLV